ncbi:hypothetical protein [Actinomycetospora straminea]|uniref:Uncharacterized protein n=1 Tax=Actinomycetospora straminea TaxID=663607 RepID=A0ABP9EUL7_9PSEU|nr:hypothetical protein [Actinomycetospora straminea]MDD7934956.1 hypothetical protein [Actinomycetospora straminea]
MSAPDPAHRDGPDTQPTPPTPPRPWAGEAATPPHGGTPGVTSTGSWRPTSTERWTSPAGVPRAATRRERARTAGRPTPPSGLSTGAIARAGHPDRLAGTRRRLVALARVLAGGLVVLAVVVVVAPWFLGGPGAGVDTVAAHLMGAVVAVGATAIAAHRRTSSGVAVLAAAAVPVILFLLLAITWWA